MKCTCRFNNPKGTATAVIIKDNKLLLVKRTEEPYKGMWDLPGGYMNEGETPKETMHRELKEEFGTEIKSTFIKSFPGTATFEGEDFAILSHAFLVELKGDITLNDEISAYKFVPIEEVKEVAYDSNNDIVAWVKENWQFDLDRVRYLISQLDPTAVLEEQALYKSTLSGYLETIYARNELIGMGWIYPRQTALRHQAVIEDMIVDEPYRGQGYGDLLLTNLLAWAKEQGVEVVELTSGYHRKAAHALYKRHDFKIHETAHMLKCLE